MSDQKPVPPIRKNPRKHRAKSLKIPPTNCINREPVDRKIHRLAAFLHHGLRRF